MAQSSWHRSQGFASVQPASAQCCDNLIFSKTQRNQSIIYLPAAQDEQKPATRLSGKDLSSITASHYGTACGLSFAIPLSLMLWAGIALLLWGDR
jgi:hypothetical protein